MLKANRFVSIMTLLLFVFMASLLSAPSWAADLIGSENTIANSSGGGNTLSNSATNTDFFIGSNNTGDNTSGGDNHLTNAVAGVVGDDIIGSNNLGSDSNGGSNSLYNYGTVDGNIHGSYNDGADSSGGGNYINNSGSTTYLMGSLNMGAGSSGGGNTIVNSGRVGPSYFSGVYGSSNFGKNSSGGSNTIYNSGTVDKDLQGSDNLGENSSGGSNTIYNSGQVGQDIAGSTNEGVGSSGGSNTIYNSGAVSGNVYGSDNYRDGSSGGGNRIYNSGTVTGSIYGSDNYGDNSSSSGNTIINSGRVGGDIYGSRNHGTGSSGGNDSITNSGAVDGSIYGADGNDSITNSGTVAGDIDAGSGNDTVTMQTGPSSVGGNIDGGDGYDAIVFAGGTWRQTDPILFNFENYQINATHNLTLLGDWTIGANTAYVSGGTLNLKGNLQARGFKINSGTANILGIATINGYTTVYGVLNINSGGTMNSVNTHVNKGGTLNLNSGGTLNSVNAHVNGGGTLNLNSGGTMNSVNTHVNKGGTLNLRSGGTLNSSYTHVNSGGVLNLDSGGTLNGAYAYVNSGGDLYVNGVLNSTGLYINSGGMLYGTGVINSDLVIYGGVAPGNSMGTLSVNSTVSFEEGSTYFANIQTDGSSNLISASGAVSLNGGAVSTFLPKALYTDGFSWTLISAEGGISGNFAGVDGQPDSQTLSLVTVNTGNNLELRTSRKSFGEFAGTKGGVAAGKGLDSIIAQAKENNDAMAGLIYAMDWEFSKGEISQAVQAMSPEIYTAFSKAALTGARMFDQAAKERLSELRRAGLLGYEPIHQASGNQPAMAGSSMQSPGNPVGDGGRWGVWTRFLAGKGSWDGGQDYLSHDQYIAGVAVGADGPINDWLRVGFSTGMTRSDLDWSGINSSGDQDGTHLGLYAQAVANGFYVNASGSYSSFSNEAERDIAFSDIRGTAKADFDSKALLGRVEAGYDWVFDNWLLSPSASLCYIDLDEDGFSEGGADYLNLNIEERGSQSLASSLGLRSAGRFQLGEDVKLIARLGLFWLHEFEDDAPGVTASFRDYGANPFSTFGRSPEADRALVEAGLEFRFSETVSGMLEYNLEMGENHHFQSVNAGISSKF